MEKYDVTIIGGGPAGLSAAKKASSKDNRVLLIEREGKLGGILKQCIHDGFGLTRYKEKLSGCEYAYREIEALPKKVQISLLTFVTKVTKDNDDFILDLVNPQGAYQISTKKVILATGCRERTAKQVYIQGTNPAGVMTAGQAQHYINLLGKMPGKEFVILGSGDIGLIMARRITLEGGHVNGVYEVKNTPSGLSRNIAQCLLDFDIPLHLSHTVTRVFGVNRLEAVEISRVDDHMNVIPNTSEVIKCDTLILSVGLIPENELGMQFGIRLNLRTKGPEVDQNFMTSVDSVYSCGNSTHVNDLADYVSESGEISGVSAANCPIIARKLIQVKMDNHLAYVVPSMINLNGNLDNVIFYFRVRDVYKNADLLVRANGEVIFKKHCLVIRPPEMERVVFSIPKDTTEISFELEEKK